MCVCARLEVQAGKKKGQKSAASKKKSTKSKSSTQRKSNSKSGQPYAGNDLTAKLFATMEKHKDVSVAAKLQLQLIRVLCISVVDLCVMRKEMKMNNICWKINHWRDDQLSLPHVTNN